MTLDSFNSIGADVHVSTKPSRSGNGNAVPKKKSPSAVKSDTQLNASLWYALIRPK